VPEDSQVKLKWKRSNSTVAVSRVRKKPEPQSKNKRNFGLEFQQPAIQEKSKFRINLVILALLFFAIIAKSKGMF
jgi:hypothetical protein